MHKQLDTLKDLIPDTANVNKGSERGNYMLDWSISQLGAGRSILADADGRVIAGNKTLDAAAERDLPIRVVQTDGKELVVVQRTDLRLEGEGDERTLARQLAIADNRTSEIGYVADAEILLAHLQSGVDLSAMYKDDELQKLLEDIGRDTGIMRGEEDGAVESMNYEYRVIVDCRDEMHQTELLRRFEQEGLSCRALIV
jgi:hypothetical protein